MVKVPVYNAEGKEVRQADFDESLLGERVLVRTLHEVLRAYQRNQRQGTVEARRRGYVSGSNRKLWRQKGTGRARVGDRRPPHWRGGGVAHGPEPKEYRRPIPARMRATALKSALLSKLRDGEIKVVEGLSFGDGPRTAKVAGFMKGSKTKGATLFALPESDANFYLSARNIPRSCVRTFGDLNAFDVMRHRNLVVVGPALDALAKRAAHAKGENSKGE